MYNVILRRFRSTIVVVGKQCMYYILWVCVCSFRYQARKAHAPILSSVACPALQYSSALSHTRHDFRKKKKLLNIKCVFWFPLQLLSEAFLIMRKTEWDIITKIHSLSCKIAFIIVRFQWKFNLIYSFPKKRNQYLIKKIRPVGAEFFHADIRTDGQTDRHEEADGCFSPFCLGA